MKKTFSSSWDSLKNICINLTFICKKSTLATENNIQNNFYAQFSQEGAKKVGDHRWIVENIYEYSWIYTKLKKTYNKQWRFMAKKINSRTITYNDHINPNLMIIVMMLKMLGMLLLNIQLKIVGMLHNNNNNFV